MIQWVEFKFVPSYAQLILHKQYILHHKAHTSKDCMPSLRYNYVHLQLSRERPPQISHNIMTSVTLRTVYVDLCRYWAGLRDSIELNTRNSDGIFRRSAILLLLMKTSSNTCMYAAVKSLLKAFLKKKLNKKLTNTCMAEIF